jgi:hypothetical protein
VELAEAGPGYNPLLAEIAIRTEGMRFDASDNFTEIVVLLIEALNASQADVRLRSPALTGPRA